VSRLIDRVFHRKAERSGATRTTEGVPAPPDAEASVNQERAPVAKDVMAAASPLESVPGVPGERESRHSWGDGPPPGPRSQNLQRLNAGLDWQERAKNIEQTVETLGIVKGDPILVTSTFDIEYPGVFERVIPDIGTIEFAHGRGPSGDGTAYIQKIDLATLEELRPSKPAQETLREDPTEEGPGEGPDATQIPFRHDGGVEAVAFSPDASRLATASADGTARVWDSESGAEQLTVRHDDTVAGVAFSPDGARLATASWDGTARIWALQTGAEQLRFRVPNQTQMYGVAFSPDGARLAAAGNGGARVWDVVTGEEQLEVHHSVGAQVTAVAFTGDGARLATAGSDGTARIWDAVTGEEQLQVHHDAKVTGVAFSPDGSRLATASGDHTARVWDAVTGAEQLQVRHEWWVTGVAFSPDGTRLATASYTGTSVRSSHAGVVRVLDAITGAEQVRLPHGTMVDGVSFSPDGTGLATGSFDKVALVFTLRGDDLT
jgi:WD40 repeat protein